MKQIDIIPIGSGSTGNAMYVRIGPHQLLIDMGIGLRKIDAALKLHGRDIEDLDAIFLTHGHGDHVKGALPISHHTHCPIFADQSVMYPIRDIDPRRRIALPANTECEILPDLMMTSFSVPHDYVKTCGFTFTYEGRKLGYLTDCGQMNDNIIDQLSGSDVVVIECNHDLEMLRNGPYPIFLQERIHSRYGHLSNDDCADTIRKLYLRGTRNFLLAHLSRHNNTPETALQTVLNRNSEPDIDIYVCPVEGNDLLTY